MAEKGFPLSYKKIKEYALSILCTKDPTCATIGENWAQQFVACFEDWIGVKACGIMEKKHASALNPATVSNYFKLLKTTLTHHNILPKNIYNCDEMGCPLNIPSCQKVIVSATCKSAKTVSSASKDHITVLEFICANGTSTPPIIIFPGKNFMERWRQDNPLLEKYMDYPFREERTDPQFRYAQSEKGWVNTDIFEYAIRKFDEETWHKLNYPDQFCLLIVDGHSSHESLNTITYCQEHKIVLFVLLSHCTHALQPLDVVLFSPLKQSWAAAVTEHEFNGESVTKDNFIKVYSSAHLHAFTKANILAAFRKTSIYPFNPLVIMKAQMAPSTMNSINGADAMLIQLTSPVKKVMQLFHDEHEQWQTEQLTASPSQEGIPPM